MNYMVMHLNACIFLVGTLEKQKKTQHSEVIEGWLIAPMLHSQTFNHYFPIDSDSGFSSFMSLATC